MTFVVDLTLPDGHLKRVRRKQRATQSTKVYVCICASQSYREDSQQLPASFAALVPKAAVLLRLIFSEEEGNRTVEYHVIVVSQVVDLLERPVLEGKLV